ncbi:MAG: Unknown protein [uncultured Sulfurovum sp.]|uniref:Uncharacterized protein n=1 Tax=uncultured Sulfurovum sp. TaxID=269237 RepID=A0A6S6U7G1_9BACT|nr:MAG: Unknown protein [uncultured Sulfurovum sp.]
MGLSTKLNSILQNPLVETFINLIKKLKSSKSYWSVSYLVLLFTLREAIAWKFGSAIRTFCEEQATESSMPFVWDILGFVFDVGGSIELVGLGLFIFIVLSVVKVSDSETNAQATPFKEKLLGFVIALALMLGFFSLNYYQHQSTTSEITKNIDAKFNQNDKQLEEIKALIKLQGGDETAFLEKYFGSDYKQVLKNPQTYQNLKEKLQQHQGSIQTLIEEKEKLQKKIESRRLHSNGVQKMIDKAFKELRFEDVLDLLNHFIKNNEELEKDLLNAHYQKALAYMEQLKYHKAKEEYETYIPLGIKDTDILHDYGFMYYQLGEYDNYLTINMKRLELLLKSSDENNPQIAKAYNEIALAWENKGEYDKAIEFHNKSLKIKLATLGENHPSTATSYNNIGGAWYSKGEYDKAIEFHNKALKIRLATLGENHPETATSYNNIGTAWYSKGEYGKAIEFYNKDLKINLATLGENHPSTATSYNNMGTAWESKGEYDKAIKFYNKALKIRLATLGENHPSTATTYKNIGLVWDSKGEYDKAIEFHNKALKIRLATLGENHPLTATSYNNIAVSYYYMQKYQKSFEFMERALKIREAMLPASHPLLIESRNSLETIRAKVK